VVEVSVDKKDGAIKVHRLVCAVECGPYVNPAIIKANVTGAIIMGLSVAFGERVDFSSGGVASANFYNDQELQMSQVSKEEVHIIKNKKTMGGIGEPGLPPIAPAVANAVFGAAGIRIRRIPMDPVTILQAIQKHKGWTEKGRILTTCKLEDAVEAYRRINSGTAKKKIIIASRR